MGALGCRASNVQVLGLVLGLCRFGVEGFRARVQVFGLGFFEFGRFFDRLVLSAVVRCTFSWFGLQG